MRRRLAVAIPAALLVLLSCVPQGSATLSISQAGWSWGNPTPQGNQLNAVAFAGGTGYAVGDFGTALRTDDGGATWSQLVTGTSLALSRLQVIDRDTVAVLADNGCSLRRSDDGGKTFHKVFVTVEGSCRRPVGSFSFATKLVGYLILGDGSVLRTGDGGRTFTPRTPIPGTSAAGAAPREQPSDVAFTGPDTGLVVVGFGGARTAYSTSDGGVSWHRLASLDARNVASLYFLDQRHGFAVGSDVLFKTADGGVSWTAEPGGPGHNLEAIRCSDAQTCLMTASGAHGEPHFVVLRTTDGGQTVTQVTAVQAPTPAVAFASAKRVVALGYQGRMFVSDDGGLTFGQIGRELFANYAGLRAGATPAAAFAFGERGALAVTTDGGNDWNPLQVPTSSDLRDVSFPSADDGYALDHDGRLFETKDAGKSWRRVGTGLASAPRALAAAAPGTIVLVGPRGIFRSSSAQPSRAVGGPDVAHAALSAIEQRPGLLVAYGLLSRDAFRSLDGGATWTRIPLPKHTSVRGRSGLDFVDANVGFLVDAHQRVWKTVSGGRHWTELLGVGNDEVYGVAMTNRSDGFAALRDYAGATSSAVVLRTSDGGETWRPQAIAPGPVRALIAPAARNAFVLVGKQHLFFTTSGGDAGEPTTITLRAVAKSAGRITIRGTLSGGTPAGEQILVSRRDLSRPGWSHRLVTAGAGGTFTTTWRTGQASVFVAQWAGDSGRAGAGSKPLLVTVSRGRS